MTYFNGNKVRIIVGGSQSNLGYEFRFESETIANLILELTDDSSNSDVTIQIDGSTYGVQNISIGGNLVDGTYALNLIGGD